MIQQISDVARDTGLNRGTLTRLYYETAERVELGVLDALCRYFGIDLPDLLERVPDKEAAPARASDAKE